MSFRPVTVLCFLVAAGFGWNLFQVKHATALLDRELAGIADQIKSSQKQKETLESVWGTLNDLPRLRQLSQKLLPQEMSQTPQNRSFAELERRLPATQPLGDAPSSFAVRDGASAPDIAIALLPPAPAPAAPQVVLAGVAAPPRPVAAAAIAAVAPAPAPAPAPLAAPDVVVAEDEPLPLPPPAPPHLLAVAEPRTVLASAPRPVASAPRSSLPAVAAPALATPAAPGYATQPIAYARPAPPRPLPAPMPAPEPPARSMLGGLGAPLLAPPVPYGTASAATLGGNGR